MATSSASAQLDQTVAVQRAQIAYQGCALHAHPVAQLCHAPAASDLQRIQDRRLRDPKAISAWLHIKALGNHPGYTPQFKTGAVFYRRQVHEVTCIYT